MRRKPISGFPGYWVTDTGKVLSGMEQRSTSGYSNGFKTVIHRQPIRELRQTFTTRYLVVGLFKDGKMTLRRVHQLVLETFISSRPPGNVARHLDANTRNNVLANLAWGTISENALDRHRNGVPFPMTRPELRKLTDEEFMAIRDTEHSYGIGTRLARQYGISVSHVSAIRTGHRQRTQIIGFHRKNCTE